jgi:hypothetical protein
VSGGSQSASRCDGLRGWRCVTDPGQVLQRQNRLMEVVRVHRTYATGMPGCLRKAECGLDRARQFRPHSAGTSPFVGAFLRVVHNRTGWIAASGWCWPLWATVLKSLRAGSL